jgi:hypothetical protein
MATTPTDSISTLTTTELSQLGSAVHTAITEPNAADVRAATIPTTMDEGIFAHANDVVGVYWSSENTTYAGRTTDYCADTQFDTADGQPYDGPPIATYHVAYHNESSLWHKFADADRMLRLKVANPIPADADIIAVAACRDDNHHILKPHAFDYDQVVDFNTGMRHGSSHNQDFDFDTIASPTVLAARPFKPHHSIVQFIDADTGQIHSDFLNGMTDLPPMPPLPPYRRSTTSDAPTTTRQAPEGADAIFWLHGIIKEHAGYVRTPTFKYVNLEESANARDGLCARWVFAYK